MDINQITPDYAVSPQIAASDVATLVEAGFKTIICNRPDVEVPVEYQADAIRAAVEAHGLRFVLNPITHGQLNQSNLDLQAEGLNAEGPTFAYCASGNRSTVMWALVNASTTPADDLINAAAAGGYSLEGLRPQLEALATS